ncbi:hypothetical protein [Halorussus caseinilyticus]|uniref:Uncharacterized protein n=1 Tax=Halorussus caseinilyticus TaxID=3034025 RepID=A0ABD5WLD8_9EURY
MCLSASTPSERGGERYSIEERVLSFLQENDQQAYNVQEVTEAVMDIGWSESNVEHPSKTTNTSGGCWTWRR